MKKQVLPRLVRPGGAERDAGAAADIGLVKIKPLPPLPLAFFPPFFLLPPPEPPPFFPPLGMLVTARSCPEERETRKTEPEGGGGPEAVSGKS